MLQALSFCSTLFRSNGVIHQCSPPQPGSPQPSSLPTHPLRENGKQQRFPHKGSWSGCHSPLPPQPKSSGFPVSPRAVWSMMRYWAEFLGHECFHQPASPMWDDRKTEALRPFFVTTPSLFVSLPLFFPSLSSSFLPFSLLSFFS